MPNPSNVYPCPFCSAKLTSKKSIPTGTSLTCPKCNQKFVTRDPDEPPTVVVATTTPKNPPRTSTRGDDDSRANEPRDSREDDDPPRRRRRRGDEPRRRRYEEDERDRYDDDEFEYPAARRPRQKGQGLAITALILGITGIVVSFASGGPFLCGMCCLPLVALSWVISTVGSLLGAGGITFGLLSRKAGSSSPMSIWGICLGAAGFVLGVVGLILSFLLPAAIVATTPDPSTKPGSSNVGNGIESKSVYRREVFRRLVVDKNKEQVRALIGKPDSTQDDGNSSTWHYKNRTKDPLTGRTDPSAEVIFEGDRAVRVNY